MIASNDPMMAAWNDLASIASLLISFLPITNARMIPTATAMIKAQIAATPASDIP